MQNTVQEPFPEPFERSLDAGDFDDINANSEDHFWNFCRWTVVPSMLQSARPDQRFDHWCGLTI